MVKWYCVKNSRGSSDVTVGNCRAHLMTEANPDDAVAQQAANGDRHAQEELLASFRLQLRRMIEVRLDRRLAPRTDASDIVQEALTAALLRLPEYFADPKISFYP